MFIPAALIMAALAGAPAGAQVPPTPQAQVAAGLVTHPAERITIRLPETAVHVGSERFSLYDVADAEVHVFVEADKERRIRRLYWVQFESYLPSRPELAYDYADGNRKIELAGTATWLRAGPASTSGPMRAGSDREHVIGILKRAGIAIPAEVMNVRLVQLLDDPAGTGKGRRELMVIYSEDLAPTGKRLADLMTDDKPNADWAPLERELVGRATESVTIERN